MPKAANNVARATLWEGVIRFTDGTVKRYQKDLVRIASSLDGEIKALAMKLESAAGNLIANTENLGRVVDMRNQIDILLANSGYTGATSSFLSQYPDLQQHVEHAWNASGLPQGLRSIDSAALRAISGAQFDSFANIGKTGAEQLKRALMLGVAGGQSFETLGRDLKEILLGDPTLIDKAGKGMFRHAATLARTAISELHSTMTNNLAVQAGIKRFEYVGPLVSTSRQFCIQRRGKEYSIEQIRQMDNGQTGKGTVFIARGGFNCNHQWMPVVNEDDILIEEEGEPPLGTIPEPNALAMPRAPTFRRPGTKIDEVLRQEARAAGIAEQAAAAEAMNTAAVMETKILTATKAADLRDEVLFKFASGVKVDSVEMKTLLTKYRVAAKQDAMLNLGLSPKKAAVKAEDMKSALKRKALKFVKLSKAKE